MEEDHVATLHKARERLLEARRGAARDLVAPTALVARGLTDGRPERFIALQQAIEAVDAALDEERGLKPAG